MSNKTFNEKLHEELFVANRVELKTNCSNDPDFVYSDPDFVIGIKWDSPKVEILDASRKPLKIQSYAWTYSYAWLYDGVYDDEIEYDNERDICLHEERITDEEYEVFSKLTKGINTGVDECFVCKHDRPYYLETKTEYCCFWIASDDWTIIRFPADKPFLSSHEDWHCYDTASQKIVGPCQTEADVLKKVQEGQIPNSSKVSSKDDCLKSIDEILKEAEEAKKVQPD